MNTNDFSWATHEPLLKVLLDIANPDFVLELGVGNYSTPLFKDVSIYKGIENDKNWIDRIKTKYPWADIEHHDLGSMNFRSRFKTLTTAQKLQLIKYYKSVDVPSVKSKMIFIDGYACTRALALQVFKSKFDIIVFHDAQPTSDGCYCYSKVDTKGFYKYYLTSASAWTCILVKENIGNQIKEQITPYIEEFKRHWDYKNAHKIYRNRFVKTINDMEVING